MLASPAATLSRSTVPFSTTGFHQGLEGIVRYALRAVIGRVRDTWQERSFRGLGSEPVYSGVYPTYEAAIDSLPTGSKVGFDDPAIPGFYEHFHFGLNPHDYPVLFWLGQIYQPGCPVFDFGGGVGQCRYAYGPFLQRAGHHPEQASWTVCDLPAFVTRGAQLATEKGMGDLHFTSDLLTASDTRIFLTNGALQYLHHDLPELLAALAKHPEHVLINRIPVTDGPGYYTVQRTRHHSYAPYRVINREELRLRMEALGYRLEDSWQVPRTLHVNFHPERDVQNYSGFYFRKETESIAAPPAMEFARSA